MMWSVKLFYYIKAFIPRRLQLFLRRKLVRMQLKQCSSVWPINEEAAKKVPENWTGWPDNKKFALVLTHDVEWLGGQKKVRQLAELEMELGFRSSFNFVPQRYPDDPQLRRWLLDNGFEVGVHDLKHDGKLFSSKKIFEKSAPEINRYLKDWQVSGFRSGSMLHNLQWISQLDIKYDASTFDTDPFEPQADGVNTIFPFWYKAGTYDKSGFVELPYTLMQDFMMYIIMQEKTNRIWKEKLQWIVKHGGMALLIVHPDYINLSNSKRGSEEYSCELYSDLLLHVKDSYNGQFWNALPHQMASFYKKTVLDSYTKENVI